MDMDELFDLDFAFTMPEADSADKLQPDAESTAAAARRLVDSMPAAAAGPGGDTGCVVCLEELRLEGTGRRIPCGHVFHDGCISDWLSLHNSCPLCRRKILL